MILLLLLLLSVFTWWWSAKHIDGHVDGEARHRRIYWWRWSDPVPGHCSRQWEVGWLQYWPRINLMKFVFPRIWIGVLSRLSLERKYFPATISIFSPISNLLSSLLVCFLLSFMHEEADCLTCATNNSHVSNAKKIGWIHLRHSNPSVFQNWLNEYFSSFSSFSFKWIHRTDLLEHKSADIRFDSIRFVYIYVAIAAKDIFIV